MSLLAFDNSLSIHNRTYEDFIKSNPQDVNKEIESYINLLLECDTTDDSWRTKFIASTQGFIDRGLELNDNIHGNFLQFCAANDRDELIEILFGFGANINISDSKGNTTLHVAAVGARRAGCVRLALFFFFFFCARARAATRAVQHCRRGLTPLFPRSLVVLFSLFCLHRFLIVFFFVLFSLVFAAL